MRFKICIGVLLLVAFGMVSAQTNLSIPAGPAAYDSSSVIIDPESGNNIVCNQLQVIFKESLTKNQQISSVNSVNGKIAGYLNDLNIYQIIVPNRKCDFTGLKKLREKLEKHRYVYQASYRVVEGTGLETIEIVKIKPERQGQLDMQPAERKKPEKPSEMEVMLAKNKKNLHSCIQQFPGVHGDMEIRIIINPKGAVKEVVVLKSTVKNKKVIDCVKYKVGKWDNFPLEAKGFDRNLEFSFKL